MSEANNHRAQNRSVYGIHEDYSGLPAPSPFGSAKLFKIIPDDFSEHGAFVQDVLYADFAGAKIGDTAIAEKDN